MLSGFVSFVTIIAAVVLVIYLVTVTWKLGSKVISKVPKVNQVLGDNISYSTQKRRNKIGITLLTILVGAVFLGMFYALGTNIAESLCGA